MMRQGVILSLALAQILLASVTAQIKPRGDTPTRLSAVEIGLLGAETRAPTAAEAKTYKLPFAVRRQGQVVMKVLPKGPAAKAGIRRGDVILALNANTIFSKDDIADFVRVTKPGTKVIAEVVRAGTSKKKKLPLTLGTRKVRRPTGIPWEYSGLAQLKMVQKLAKDDRKRILVGLSGAET